MRRLFCPAVLALGLSLVSARAAAPLTGRYYSVEYPPPASPGKDGELQFGVNYTVWIPDGVKTLRGVIVHQHGCGSGACKGGETAAYDLHWQALARKHGCALLGPSYRQEDSQNCRLWCDPRNGSRVAFLRGLKELAAQSGHPELETAPWCLWGHSGGGFWASLMQASDPERIVAIWFRSGTAFATWEKGEIPKPTMPDAAMGIPMMANPGAKENGDPRFSGAWTGLMAMFRAYRERGAPIGFAPDPRTGHECGDSRYLAIPFFDACLRLRLPDRPGRPLKKINVARGWLAKVLGDEAVAASAYNGDPKEAGWLPDAASAQFWSEYVKTGAASDGTPPAAPLNVSARRGDDGVTLTWDAEADFESGLKQFVIQRDGRELARYPEAPVGRYGRPLFQTMSYHDTPEKPLPPLRYVDRTAQPGTRYEYRVLTVNGVGLRSEPSAPSLVR